MSARCSVCQGCACNLGLEDVHTGYCECRRCGGCSCNLQGSEMNRLLLAYCRCTTYQGCMCVNYYRVLPPHVVRDTAGKNREERYQTQEDPNYQENPNYYQEEEYGQEPPPPPEQWFQAPTNGQDTFYPQSQEGSPYQAGTIHRGRNQGRQAPPPSVNYRERQPQSNPSNNENPYICEQCNGCLCARFPYIRNSNYCTCDIRAVCSCYQGRPPCPPPLPTFINWDEGSRVTTPSGRPPMVAPLAEPQARQSRMLRPWGGSPGSNGAHAQQEAQNPTGQQAAQRQAPRAYPAGYRQHQGAPHSYREGAYRPGYQESQVPRRAPQPPRANPTNAATAQQQTTQRPQANRPKPDSPYRSIG